MRPPAESLAAFNQHRPTYSHNSGCWAPTASIYWGHRGVAYPCCWNRADTYGQYPQQSVQEILEGAARKQLKDQLDAYDYPPGCFQCSEEICSGNYSAPKVLGFDDFAPEAPGNQSWWQRLLGKRHPPPEPKPLITKMEFELHNTCNLECVMCSGEFSSSIRKNREGLPPIPMAYDAAFLEQLTPYLKHLKLAGFYGGEPFLVDMYLDIWERLLDTNDHCKIYVQTNATVLNNRVKSLLERAGNRMDIGLSIDSLDPQTYPQIRVNGKYERMRANLDYFIDHSRRHNSSLALSVCPLTLNWQELPAFVPFCEKHGVHLTFHKVQAPPQVALPYAKRENLAAIIDALAASYLPEDRPSQAQQAFNSFYQWLSSLEGQAPLAEASGNVPTRAELESRIQLLVLTYAQSNNENPIEVEQTVLSKFDQVIEMLDSPEEVASLYRLTHTKLSIASIGNMVASTPESMLENFRQLTQRAD